MWKKINSSLLLGLITAAMMGLTWSESLARPNRESVSRLAPKFLVTPQWQKLTPNPDPVHNAPAARYNHSLEYSPATNTLYLFGGQQNASIHFNDVWALNLGTLTWQRLFADTSGGGNTAYPLQRRTALMSVDDTGQNLYLATGQDANGTNHNDAWRFNLSSKSWQKLCTQSPCNADLPDIRYGAAGANLGGDLIVSHGFDSGRYDDTWRFDISSGTWDKISPNTNLPIGRCLVDGALVGNKFVIHGGQSNPDPYRADTWIFNLNTSTWTEVATGGTEGTTKPAGRHHQSLVEYVDENGVLLFGGLGPSNTHYNDLWFLDLASNSWQKLTPTGTAPSGRRSHGAAWVEAIGNRPAGMMVFGGRAGNTILNDLWLLGFTTGPAGNPGALQFSSSSYNVAETGLQATITITRSGGTSGTVTIQYETGEGTAVPGQNYTPTSGTLTFNHGEAGPKSFTVPVIEQPTADGNKSVNLSLKNPTGGATIGTPAAAVLTILDTNMAGLLRYTIGSYGAAETAVQATIQVSRTGGASGVVTVQYIASGGTALVGQDYTPVSGTLTFNNGETGPKTFAVPLTDDSQIDGDKTVNLSLANPTGGAALGNPNAATLTIFDSDAAGQLSFTLSNFNVNEANGNAVINVSRTGGVSGTVTIDYETSGGTASPGSDYTPVSGTLTFNHGQTGSKSFTVPLLADNTVDGAKTVNLVLKNPQGGVSLGTPSAATLLISDADTTGQLRFTLNSFQVQENTGSAVISVTRVGGVSGVVMVDYQASGGTASPGSDYTPVSGTLTFNSGQSGPKSFAIPILNDDTPEASKTVALILKNPKGGAILGNPNAATLTILDEDEAQGNETSIYLPAILKRFTDPISEHDADLIFEEVIQE